MDPLKRVTDQGPILSQTSTSSLHNERATGDCRSLADASYYRKLPIRCGDEKRRRTLRVGNANPGGNRVDGDATDVEGRVGESGAGREAGEQLFELDEIARMGSVANPDGGA